MNLSKTRMKMKTRFKRKKSRYTFTGYSWSQKARDVVFKSDDDEPIRYFTYAFFAPPDPLKGCVKFGRFDRKRYKITVEEI